MEERAVHSAAGIVVAADEWRETFARRFKVPAVHLANGVDPEAFQGINPRKSAGRFVIRHIGMIYEGRRDPSPLFKGVMLLSPELRRSLRIEFIGRYLEPVKALAQRLGLEDVVITRDQVSYPEAKALEVSAQLQLLLISENPSEASVYPGKLYEYLSAGRPILVIGNPAAGPARLVTKLKAGWAMVHPQEIARHLSEWVSGFNRGRAWEPPGPTPEELHPYTVTTGVAGLLAFANELRSGQT